MLTRAMAVAAGMAASAAAFGSGVTLTPILVEGQQAPGKPLGFTIKSVGNVPTIGDGGHVVTDWVRLAGPGINPDIDVYYIDYTGMPGALSVFLDGGLPAGPLGPDEQFQNSPGGMKSRPNAAGDFVFATVVSGPSVDSSNDSVMFAYQGGVISVLFRESSFYLPPFPNGEFVNGNGDLQRGARLLDNGNLVTRIQMKGGSGGAALQDNLLAGPVGAPVVRLAWGVPPPGCAENLLSLNWGNSGNEVSPAGKFFVMGALAGAASTSDNVLWTGDANGGAVSLWLREGGSLPGLDPANVTVIASGQCSINDAGEAVTEVYLQTGVGDAVNENAVVVVYGTPGNLSVLARANDQVPGLPPGVRYGHNSWCGVYNGGVVLGKTLVGNVTSPNVDGVILAGPPGSLSVKMRSGDPAPGFPAGYTLGAFNFGSRDSLKMHVSGRFVVETRVISDTGTNLTAIYTCTPDSSPQLVCASGQVLEVAPGDLRMVKESGIALYFGSGDGTINALGQFTFNAEFTDDTAASMIASVSPMTGPSFAAAGTPTVSDAAGSADGVADPGESMIGLTIPVFNSGVLGATGVTATLTSLTPTVTVQTASASYPNLASGGAAAGNTTPFVINVSPSHPCGADISLQLQVASAQGTNVVNLVIPAGQTYPGCAAFALAPPTILSDSTGNGNGNGIPEPGESQIRLTIPVTKSGGGGMSTGVSATLTTSTPTASIVTGTAAYPNIAAAATQSNTTPFVIALSPSHPCGAPVNLHLSVSADGGLGMGEMDLAPINGGIPAATTPIARTGIGASVPDNDVNGVAVTFDVSGINAPITDLDFRFTGTSTTTLPANASTGLGHANVGELVISLTSPDPDGAGPLTGITVVLADHPGPNSTANNLRQCTFDDAAGGSIQTIGSPTGPITGSFKPFQSLSVFNGLSGAAVNGTWVLKAADTVASTGGANGGQGGFVRNATLFISNPTTCVAPGCPADFNHDGGRDVADLFAYINAWLAKTANADFNGSGTVDVADLFAYINAWLAGC